jgi:hypothetical protein
MLIQAACRRCRTDRSSSPTPASGKSRRLALTAVVVGGLLFLGAGPSAGPVEVAAAPVVAGDEAPPPVKKAPSKKVGRFGSLTVEEQKRVNEAIDRGVAYLRKSQLKSGSWAKKDQPHQMGYAALAGLTLLECGVPPTDAAVKKAYRFVKFNAPNLAATYELSLAVLFLDRLGSSKDRKLIQTLALRLIAGQNSAGGWTYHCPILKTPEEQLLLTYLRQRQHLYVREAVAPTEPDPKAKGKPGEAVTDPQKKTDKKSGKPGEVVTDPNQKDPPDAKSPPEDPKVVDPLNPKAKGKDTKGTKGKAKEKGKKLKVPPKVERIRPEFLPPKLRELSVIKTGRRVKGRLVPANDDNSNTQFAIIALWAARRHYVPMEQTLLLVEERFRSSQHEGGGWAYPYKGGGQTGPMTGVGLIGLAVGHGSSMPPATTKVDAAPLRDEAIDKGLKALGGYIGQPGQKNPPMQNAYFLWTLERVGVLYNLKTIGGKDWYRWGVEILLSNQRPDGSWDSAHYHGHSPPLDTSMALLFLKRANLTQDLTESLRLRLAITDPAVAP